MISTYEEASGQTVNLSKLAFMTGKNVGKTLEKRCGKILGVPIAKDFGQSLGMPLANNRNKRQLFF